MGKKPTPNVVREATAAAEMMDNLVPQLTVEGFNRLIREAKAGEDQNIPPAGEVAPRSDESSDL
jgi:hypothetical protein